MNAVAKLEIAPEAPSKSLPELPPVSLAGMLASSKQGTSVAVTRPGDALYAAAWVFTQAHYRRRLDCALTEGYPEIVVMRESGVITAVAGIRAASASTLFLEQYLDAPVERVVSLVRGKTIARSQIVELGSFTALDRARALALMNELPALLADRQFTYLVCTANRSIRLCLRIQGIHARVIASASEDLLMKQDENWGKYYQHDPLVLMGSIHEAFPGKDVGRDAPDDRDAPDAGLADDH